MMFNGVGVKRAEIGGPDNDGPAVLSSEKVRK